MKMYLIAELGYDEGHVYGLYSSKEKAIESLPYFNLQEDDITECEVDPPNSGEKYEEFYYYNIFAKGKEEHQKTTEKPSEVEPFSYGAWNHSTCVFQGYGKTLEEAKANCYKARDNAHPVWQVFNTGTETHHADKSGVQLLGYLTKDFFCAIHEDRNVCIIALEEYKKTGKVSEFLRFPGNEK